MKSRSSVLIVITLRGTNRHLLLTSADTLAKSLLLVHSAITQPEPLGISRRTCFNILAKSHTNAHIVTLHSPRPPILNHICFSIPKTHPSLAICAHFRPSTSTVLTFIFTTNTEAEPTVNTRFRKSTATIAAMVTIVNTNEPRCGAMSAEAVLSARVSGVICRGIQNTRATVFAAPSTICPTLPLHGTTKLKRMLWVNK